MRRRALVSGLSTLLATACGDDVIGPHFGLAGRDFRSSEPPGPFTIFNPSDVILYLDARNALAVGGNVVTVADPSSGPDFSPTGTVTLNNADVPVGGAGFPSIVFGSTASFLSCQNDRPGPSTEPTYSFGLWLDANWTSNQRVISRIDGANNNMAYLMSAGGGTGDGYVGVNSSGGNPSFGMVRNQFCVHETNWSGNNTVTDFAQCYAVARGLMQAGVNFGGVQGRFGFSFGRGLNRRAKVVVQTKVSPTLLQRIALYRWAEWIGGANAVRVPVPANVVPFVICGQSNSICQGTTGVTPSYTPGTENTPLAVITKTSEFTDAAPCPSSFRIPFSRIVPAGIGPWGPEIGVAAAMATAGRPTAFAKVAVGSTDLDYAVSGAGKDLMDSLLDEYRQDQYWNSATKATIFINRGETDATESRSRTSTRDLMVSLVNTIKAKLPASCLGDCRVIFLQVNPLMVPGNASIPTINLGIDDAVALIPNSVKLPVDGTRPGGAITLGPDNQHYANAGLATYAADVAADALAH